MKQRRGDNTDATERSLVPVPTNLVVTSAKGDGVTLEWDFLPKPSPDTYFVIFWSKAGT